MNQLIKRLKGWGKRKVKSKPTTSNKTYTSSKKRRRAIVRIRNRIIAAAMAGSIIAGVGYAGVKEAIERMYVSNFEEIAQYNITANDLGIPLDLYEEVMNFRDKIASLDFEKVTNSELAQYFGDLGDMYLNILKAKVNPYVNEENGFKLYAPTDDGGIYVPTRIIEKNSERCIGKIKSGEFGEYMNNVVELQNLEEQLKYGNINRDASEKKLNDMTEKLGEVITINIAEKRKR